MKIRSKEELIAFLKQGNKVKYVCFWGHRKSRSGISKSCFSQWYNSSFEIDGITYPTAEHYMMAEKARLFGDKEMRQAIIASSHPGEAKKLGRKVRGFDEQIWRAHRFEIVIKGNMAKFAQNPALSTYLLNTGQSILVETSPFDRIWGGGLASDHANAQKPHLWRGLNLLGFALMEVRERLRAGE